MTDDYIKREDAIKAFENICIPRKATNGIVVLDIDEALSEIELVPTADVIAVVRCKDCKHKIEDDYSDGNVPDLICKEWDIGVDINDYCSYGEREE